MSDKEPKPSFYLHIGIHKTGSTFLQQKLFPLFDRITYWHKPKFDILSGEKPTSLSRFMNVSPLVWRELGDRFWGMLREGSPPDFDILLSDEHAIEANDPFTIARHLREIKKVAAPSHNLQVLIVIRRQDTWFASAYAQMSNRYSKPSQAHFEKWIQDEIDDKERFFTSAGVRLKYFTLIRKMQDAIGKNSVSVLPYELLKANPIPFIEQCCSFVNRSVPDSLAITHTNRRSTSSRKWAIRSRHIQLRPGRVFQTVFGRSRILIPDWKREREISLTEGLSKFVLDRYKVENEKLDQLLNLGLKGYGYY